MISRFKFHWLVGFLLFLCGTGRQLRCNVRLVLLGIAQFARQHLVDNTNSTDLSLKVDYPLGSLQGQESGFIHNLRAGTRVFMQPNLGERSAKEED